MTWTVHIETPRRRGWSDRKVYSGDTTGALDCFRVRRGELRPGERIVMKDAGGAVVTAHRAPDGSGRR